MTEREKFMFELWKVVMAHSKFNRNLKDPVFTWNCVKSFWYPILSPVADRAGYR